MLLQAECSKRDTQNEALKAGHSKQNALLSPVEVFAPLGITSNTNQLLRLDF